MSRRVINCAKLCLSHPFDRIKWIRQWAVDRDPVLTSTTSAKIGKTAIPVDSASAIDLKNKGVFAKSRPGGFPWAADPMSLLADLKWTVVVMENRAAMTQCAG